MAIVNGTPNSDVLDSILDGEKNGGNTLNGGAGNDELFAFKNDKLFGEAGNDKLSSEPSGTIGGNTLDGGDSNDTIFSYINDSVFGGTGDDTIYAGQGGNNTIAGGTGRDIFWIANVDVPKSPNTITDFNPITDTIGVSLRDATKLSDLAIVQSGADATIRFGSSVLAIIKNTAIANLNATNIIFKDGDAKNATVNQAPAIAPTFSFAIDENSAAGTSVGSVTATDANVSTGDKLTFSISGGNNDLNANGKSPFAVNSTTGAITVNDSGDLDFERNSSIGVTVTVTDTEGLSATSQVTVKLNDLAETFPLPSKVTNYDFVNLPKLGTTSKGQDLFLGGFSGLYFQGTNATNGNLKFVTNTDRGPNGDPTGQNRPFFLPDFQPEIVSFELNRTTGTISITKRTGLFEKDGTTKLTGLPNLQAGAGGTAYTDEVAVNLDGKVIANKSLGADLEGIVVDDNGNYWMVDEYRPAIYQFDVNGKMLDRFIPKGTATAPAGTANDFAAGTFGTEVLPEVYAQRRSNRGFEAVALEGNKLYAFIQSAIDNPDSAADTTSRNSRNLRILEFDIVSKAVTGEYLYVLDNITAGGNARTDKIGDAVSLGNGKFAVVERDDLSTTESNKLIYQIDLANATNINNSANFTLPSGKTIEQLSPSELITANIKAVSKNLIVNAAKSGYTGVEKLEGLALVAPNTFALINDNDFNVVTGSNVPERLGILELTPAIGSSDTPLPVALKFKKNDSDTFTIGGGKKTKTSLSFTVVADGANQVSEIGVFVVDDAAGTIDGVGPTQAGYAEKALARSKVILSDIVNNPNGFSSNGFNRLLEFNNNDRLRFYSISDKSVTTDSIIKSKSFDKVTFSSTTSLNFKELSSGSNTESSITFNNVLINFKATNDELLLGTRLQGTREGEVLDLRGTSKVEASFVLNREAGFNNFIGFYRVVDEAGGIDTNNDGKADVLVGQSGYAQAAINNRIAGIDLSVNNQGSITTAPAVFTGNSIFAPFIIIDGSPTTINPTAYFSYLGANSDGVDHIRLLGNNTFGFEDLAGGGDFDYNDMIVKVNLKVA